jgi:prepilin-type N-terminal cleavage/methylation domain-containing protein
MQHTSTHHHQSEGQPSRARPAGRRGGFTLVELLVVISIIALLIAILLPSLRKARTQAKTTKCGAQLHDIGISLSSYASEYYRMPLQNSFGASNDPIVRDQRNGAGLMTYSVMAEIAEHMGGLEFNEDRTERTRVPPVFFCPFVPPKEIGDEANILSGNYPDGTSTGVGSEVSEDVYIQPAYFYAGGFHEVANNPENNINYSPINTSDELKQHIRFKRDQFVKKDQGAGRVLMTDMVAMWNGGGRWRINHGDGWQKPLGSGAGQIRIPRIDSANQLYGDGAVELKQRNHYREIFESAQNPISTSSIILKLNATTFFGSDAYWW